MRRDFLIRWLLASLLAIWLLPVQAASGEGAIAVIAASGHGKNLKKDDLALIYKRKRLFWTDGSRVQPVNLPVSSPMRLMFSQIALGASPEDLEKYWNDMYFHGVSPPYVLSSEESVLRFIADTPGAIGYVSYCHAIGRANIVLIITASGHLVEDDGSLDCAR